MAWLKYETNVDSSWWSPTNGIFVAFPLRVGANRANMPCFQCGHIKCSTLRFDIFSLEYLFSHLCPSGFDKPYVLLVLGWVLFLHHSPVTGSNTYPTPTLAGNHVDNSYLKTTHTLTYCWTYPFPVYVITTLLVKIVLLFLLLPAVALFFLHKHHPIVGGVVFLVFVL